MRDLVEYLAKSVVDHPERVRVEEQRTRDGVVYLVSVDPEDKGRIIGRQGRVIEAIRTLVRAYAKRRATVEVR
ncbi:KH domain-containing protein [Thermus filiformis]|uniref:RNA-binding protein KhpA n=1 Tax=Thermus filiformis TaxID=276 RepID=A0A0D6XA40_THEFI|nr:KH domain-containing protein [Thermus filiformis]KIX84532.1 RNA-binding protein [Thermus filiformis]